MNKPIILSRFSNPNKRIVLDYVELRNLVESFRGLGAQIAMTMGVFDLLHINHVEYLEHAATFGDILVVGVDSDRLTRKRKNDFSNRPLVPQDERMRMICRHANLVTLNDLGEDVNILLKIVRPDVLVVSRSTKDFETQYEKLQQWVGRVEVLDPKGEVSSTGRIRQLAIEGKLQIISELEELFSRVSRPDEEVRLSYEEFYLEMKRLFEKHKPKEGGS